jgi:hypothetical protein
MLIFVVFAALSQREFEPRRHKKCTLIFEEVESSA